jgi:hypothetical protein
MSELYPNDALARRFLPAVFEQVVHISPWYNIEYAKSLDKGLLSLSRNLRVYKSESQVIKIAERAKSSTSTTVKRGVKERRKTSRSVAADESHSATTLPRDTRPESKYFALPFSVTHPLPHSTLLTAVPLLDGFLFPSQV